MPFQAETQTSILFYPCSLNKLYGTSTVETPLHTVAGPRCEILESAPVLPQPVLQHMEAAAELCHITAPETPKEFSKDFFREDAKKVQVFLQLSWWDEQPATLWRELVMYFF